jgi:hypothetical protein
MNGLTALAQEWVSYLRVSDKRMGLIWLPFFYLFSVPYLTIPSLLSWDDAADRF